MTEDLINHPKHYEAENLVITKIIEYKPIQFCEQFGFNLGNAFKYIFRAKHKGNELQDLKKSEWYLKRFLNSCLFPLDSPLKIVFNDLDCIQAFVANKDFLTPLRTDGITYKGISLILKNIQKRISELENEK